MNINDIYENTSAEVSLEWVKENCTEAIENMKNGYFLFRDMSIKGGIVVMSPRDKPRKSAYAQLNYYNEIINSGMNGFNGFPKREIIMTSSSKYATAYERLHLCLPVDGSRLGICSAEDIWYSFSKIPEVDEFYRIIGKMFTHKGFIDDIKEIHTIEQLKSVLARAKKENHKFPVPYYKPIDLNGTYDYRLITDYFTSDGFENVDLRDFDIPPSNSQEVWTDSPTAMIAVPSGNYEKVVELLTK